MSPRAQNDNHENSNRGLKVELIDNPVVSLASITTSLILFISILSVFLPWIPRYATSYFAPEAAYYFDDFCIDQNSDHLIYKPGKSKANFYIQEWERLSNYYKNNPTCSNSNYHYWHSGNSKCEEFEYLFLEVVTLPNDRKTEIYKKKSKNEDKLLHCYNKDKQFNKHSFEYHADQFIKKLNSIYTGSIVRLTDKRGIPGRKPQYERQWYNPSFGISQAFDKRQNINAQQVSYLSGGKCIRISRIVSGVNKDTKRLAPDFPFNIMLIGKEISCS